jgi:hypothetical protein
MSCEGHLASITSQSENDLALEVLQESSSWWIGGKRTYDPLDLAVSFSDGWKWSNGNIFSSYTNWNTGEPNNAGGNEDCVVMYNSGVWNDDDCSELKRAIYELPLSSSCLD